MNRLANLFTNIVDALAAGSVQRAGHDSNWRLYQPWFSDTVMRRKADGKIEYRELTADERLIYLGVGDQRRHYV